VETSQENEAKPKRCNAASSRLNRYEHQWGLRKQRLLHRVYVKTLTGWKWLKKALN
jgi:hypothetical protein